jgi:hypothetical protein
MRYALDKFERERENIASERRKPPGLPSRYVKQIEQLEIKTKGLP